MRNYVIALISGLCSIGLSTTAISQSKVTGTVTGLNAPDSAIVRIQKSNTQYFFVKVYGTAGGTSVSFAFNNLANGFWALSIDAPGYNYPPAMVLELNNNTQNRNISITRSTGGNFMYQWQDDSSFVGHAQQSYINTPVQIKVLGQAQTIPYDFNAINILNEYGFLLSNDSTTWTSEDAYRLYVMLGKLNFQKFGENDSVYVRAKWHITNSAIDRDIDFKAQSGLDFITISRQAFTYATPQIVTVDGVKGKFFSKRLYNAIVYYYTDKGIKKNLIDQIAQTRYGLAFMVPSAELQTLMKETYTNFQEFSSDEKLIILSMFEEFPDAMQRQSHLKYLVRRINGMPNPTYPQASAVAWTSNENIEFMESAFANQSIDFMQRLILHEKAHFLWEHTFDSTTRADWARVGGWYLDPTQMSGWSTTNTTEFVSAYAHLSNPNEDMAESIAFYITNPDALRSRSMRKFEFIRDRIMQGSRYVAMINPNMTFQVYNLFPDYNYPGKIKRSKVEVIGAPEEDKIIKVEIELNTMNNVFNGAEFAATTIFSGAGTFKGIHLAKANPEGSILRGEIKLSKYAKSGYWTIAQMAIYDQINQMRVEKSSTFGFLCYIDNPLEDLTPPLYIQNTLKLDSVSGKFIDFSGRTASQMCGPCADTIPITPALKVSFKIEEKYTINPDGRAYATIFYPSFDTITKYYSDPYSRSVQINGDGIMNDFVDSIKTAQFYLPVPEYMPRGYYSISALLMTDLALNTRMVLLDKDTANKNMFVAPKFINQRALRDSIYFHTPYPDMKPPKIDLNDIKIKATPTNPSAPNGETLFEMWVWVKDTSDFPLHASGFNHLSFTLRDPQGLETTVNMYNDINEFYQIAPTKNPTEWKQYYFKYLLPIGSPPGLWGVSSIVVDDKAGNKKYYSFVEFVRFDVESSKIMQKTPYISILDKSINASNVDSIGVRIGCPSCKDQKYRLRMYSNMGGATPVFEGRMTSDTIQLNNINLTGVNDGNLFATVFILDTSDALIGTGRAEYLKDTQIPKLVVEKTTNNTLVDTVSITVNENVTHQLSNAGIKITNGSISDLQRISNSSYRLIILRNCADSLRITILPGAVLDTVGNANEEVSFSAVDQLLPTKPRWVIPENISMCSGETKKVEIVNTGQKIQWKRNGSIISDTKSFSYDIVSSGTYTVEAISDNGCTSASDQIIATVHQKPMVEFSINNPSQCLNVNAYGFLNKSSDTSKIIRQSWYFGDGSQSASVNPLYNYKSSGVFSVKLVSTNTYGCTDSTIKNITVHPVPVAGITLNVNSQCLSGNQFYFKNNSSNGANTYSWKFGNGKTSIAENPTYSFDASGEYTVMLVSGNTYGCTDSTSITVKVHPMPVAGFSVNNTNQCLAGNRFSFSNGSNIPTGTFNSTWNLGDGTTSTSQNPSISYPTQGTYTVKLVTTSGFNCMDSISKVVKVDPSPIAKLSVAPYTSIHPGLLTSVRADVTPVGNYSYTWYRNNIPVSGENGLTVDSIGYKWLSGAYKLKVENLPPMLACSYTSPEFVIGDSVTNRIYVYPNPSNGKFKVTLYSPVNSKQLVTVTDAKGSIVYKKMHEVFNRYQLIDINLSAAQFGIYTVQIADANGKHLSSGRIIIH